MKRKTRLPIKSSLPFTSPTAARKPADSQSASARIFRAARLPESHENWTRSVIVLRKYGKSLNVADIDGRQLRVRSATACGAAANHPARPLCWPLGCLFDCATALSLLPETISKTNSRL